jgi:hypothetical protein
MYTITCHYYSDADGGGDGGGENSCFCNAPIKFSI